MENFQKEYLQGLRDLIVFLEKNNQLIPKYSGLAVHIFADNAEGMEELANGETWQQDMRFDEDDFVIRKDFGPHNVSISGYRDEVCQYVQVGSEIITSEKPIFNWKFPNVSLVKK